MSDFQHLDKTLKGERRYLLNVPKNKGLLLVSVQTVDFKKLLCYLVILQSSQHHACLHGSSL